MVGVSAFEQLESTQVPLQYPLGGWKPVPKPRRGSRPGPNYQWTCRPCKCVTGGVSCEWESNGVQTTEEGTTEEGTREEGNVLSTTGLGLGPVQG